MNKKPAKSASKHSSKAAQDHAQGDGGGDSRPKRRSAPRKGPPPSRSRGMRSHGARRGGRGGDSGGAGWIWGTHAGLAALSNPRRTIHDILLSEAAERRLAPLNTPLPARIVHPRELDDLLPPGAVHQGIAVRVAPLEWPGLIDLAGETDLILVLDQITDPHNVGAMLRLASAFGVGVVVMQDRHAPPLTGATAKVAAGCVESVPVSLVTNIANTLGTLKDLGFFATGLAGESKISLAQAFAGGSKRVVVMGAEGPGLRPRVAQTCDQLARIPMMSSGDPGTAESLNVATAAAITLYEARRHAD